MRISLKPTLSVFLALIMAVIILPMGVIAEDVTIIGSGFCGENVTYTLYSDGKLVISGTGDMYDFAWDNKSPWEDLYKSFITHVVIEDGVTRIGSHTFQWHNQLRTIEMADSVKTIGDYAITSCKNLTNLTLSNGLETIGEHGLYYLTGLESISLPSSIQYIGKNAFEGIGVTHLTIPSGVIDELAFINCKNLETVIILSGVTDISPNAFLGNDRFEKFIVDEGNKHYSSDDNGVLFSKDKTKLVFYPLAITDTEYTIPSGVTCLGEDSFTSHPYLQSVILPEGVIEIQDRAFKSLNLLHTIVLPNGLKTIGEEAFAFCDELTNLDIPTSVTTINKIANLLEEEGRFVLSVSKDQSNELDFGTRKVPLYPDNPQDIKTYLANAELKCIKEIETEFAWIIVATT